MMFVNVKELLLYFLYKYRLYCEKKLRSLLSSLSIVESEETIDYIIKNKCSVSRFGDGEFALMAGSFDGVQSYDELLAQRLREVITSSIPNHLVCVPHTLNNLKNVRFSSKLYMMGILSCYGSQMILPFLDSSRIYYDSMFTRFYMIYRDKSHCGAFVEKIKKIWEKRDICIVEGENSKLGVGNDLFSNTNSVVRIICPQRNAYSKYNLILESTIQNSGNKLILIALGMTATVLAYDLHLCGKQAIDIGNIDLEYMWYKMGATQKVPIKNRFSLEAGGTFEIEDDNKYLDQIIDRII